MTAQIRDDKWLECRLDFIWTKYFAEIRQKNEQVLSYRNKIFIKFGRFARYRLGSIRLIKKTGVSLITITAMFKASSIPKEVVDYTIGHELVHYSHGFSSPHPKLFKYPHSGGVVKKEMRERGMANLYQSYKEWVKTYRASLRRRYGW